MQPVQNSKIQVLDNLLMVGLVVNIWSARKKLQAQDLGDDLQLPPSELASLGSKRTIDPDCLKPFETLKRKGVRVLDERGIRFMGAHLIPESAAGEVAALLEDIGREFGDEKVSFLANYDTNCENWVNRPWEKPEWREAIRRSKTPKATVADRIGYRFSICRVRAEESDPLLVKGLASEVDGLSGQLFREIAEEAEGIADDTLAGASTVTQKTVNRIWKMHKKLDSLAFLNPSVRNLADYLMTELSKLPASGKLQGSDFQHLFSLVMSLSDETRISKLADVFAGAGSAQIVMDVDAVDAAAVAPEVVLAETPVTVEEALVVEEPLELAAVEANIDMAEAEILVSTEAQQVTEAAPVVSMPVPSQEVAAEPIDFCC
jgi:hypothetical protein